MKKVFLLVVSVVLTMCMICACGSKKTLESSLSSDEKQQLQSTANAYAASNPIYSSASASVKGNDVTYSYTFAQSLSTADWDAGKDTINSGLQAQMTQVANSLKSAYNLDDKVNVIVEVRNADGSLLGSFTYSSN